MSFQNDVILVLANAMTYNAATTAFYKAAERIRNIAITILSDLEEKLVRTHLELENAPQSDEATLPSLGNLEPPLALLRLLSLPETINEDTEFMLSLSPLASLFNFELPVLKPPPPPAPPKARRPTRTEQLENKKRQRLAALDSTPGFRAPRTRNARAQLAAFEAEVGVGTPVPVPGSSSVEPQPHPEGEGEGTTRKHKKSKVVLPGQSEEVPMVQDVDNQDSFKMFDGGWVLPPERRRGNRPPIEKRPVPPPRKRQKTGKSSTLLIVGGR